VAVALSGPVPEEAPLFAPATAAPVAPLAAPPSFSIVIPVYESAATVGEAIETALAQEPAPLEVIVSDDGSSDELDAALAEFEGRIAVVRGPHRGVAAARNAGWRRASGDFVLFADADDVLLPGKLAALGRLGQMRPDLDLLATDMHFERDGRRAGSFSEVNPFPLRNQRATVLERCFVVQPAFRRACLAEAGGFDESLPTGSDWDCVIRLVLGGSAAGLWDEPLAVYRIHGGSLTQARPETLGHRVRMLEKARRHPGLGDEERRVLEHSLSTYRRRARLAEAEAAVAGRRPDARRRCAELALGGGVPAKLRLWALAVAVLPGPLQRRAIGRAAPSELSRSLPTGPARP
jgi:GT2 family glycosyltransferase